MRQHGHESLRAVERRASGLPVTVSQLGARDRRKLDRARRVRPMAAAPRKRAHRSCELLGSRPVARRLGEQ